jgi:hypothetical protein
MRYITGFSSLGQMEFTGVLSPQVRPAELSVEEFRRRAPEAPARFKNEPVRRADQEFLVAECRADESRGFAGPLMTEAGMDQQWGRGRWAPMPRFLHVQPNGKRRPIDDGARYSHNLAVGFEETIECCTAAHPAVHAQALVRAARAQNALESLRQHSLETGGEDVPNAYRWVPADPSEAYANVVGVWNGTTQEHKYQVIWGQMFGRSAAVTNFHRLQRLVVAMMRRWLGLLFTMYYDDATLQDLGCATGRGQRCCRALFRLLGWPLAAHKAVDLCGGTDFLGLEHTVGDSLRTGVIEFQPRAALVEKATSMVHTMLQTNFCTPAQAAKLRGILGFLFTGAYGKVGRGGQSALLQRQYVHRPPWQLSNHLRVALRFFQGLIAMPMNRQVELYHARGPPIIMATDGRLRSQLRRQSGRSSMTPWMGHAWQWWPRWRRTLCAGGEM